MYHRFSREIYPDKVAGAEFSLHLKYLQKHKQVLSLAEVSESLSSKKPLPPNTAVITIDDGYADAFDVALPLLKQFGFPATLYAVTDFLDGKLWIWTDLMPYVLLNTKNVSAQIEFENAGKIEAKLTDKFQRINFASRLNARLKHLPNERKDAKIKEIAALLNVEIPLFPPPEYAPVTWEQAREMDDENLKIESHTVTHPILTNINQKELDFELQTSKKRLESVLEKKIEHFCYPNGSLSETVRKSVENAGYKTAMTSIYGFNNEQSNQLLLNRIGAESAIENFAQSASGFEAVRLKIKV